MSADIFGLIVGNVGLKSSKPLLEQLRIELRRAKKKSYTLSVGRLNPAKLANFETIECFVLVGCAEGGVVDSKDFYRPIVTPWELLLALKGPEGGWDPSKWTLDIEKVLQGASRIYQAVARCKGTNVQLLGRRIRQIRPMQTPLRTASRSAGETTKRRNLIS